MDHNDHLEHGHDPVGGAAAPPQFSQTEWNEFRAQDLGAAKYIVGLMLGIFAVGLLLYIGVAFWVHARVI